MLLYCRRVFNLKFSKVVKAVKEKRCIWKKLIQIKYEISQFFCVGLAIFFVRSRKSLNSFFFWKIFFLKNKKKIFLINIRMGDLITYNLVSLFLRNLGLIVMAVKQHGWIKQETWWRQYALSWQNTIADGAMAFLKGQNGKWWPIFVVIAAILLAGQEPWTDADSSTNTSSNCDYIYFRCILVPGPIGRFLGMKDRTKSNIRPLSG